MATNYIIVVGGVYSGQGKGIACSSMAFLMKQRGHTCTCIKFDPYLNTSASVLSPNEHGECFICDDGTETDLDLGSYEKIGGVTVSAKNICTAGTIYKELIEEQENKLLGTTVQVVPHFSQKIQDKIIELGKDYEICIVELGGSIGDIESAGFYEAIRQFKQKQSHNCLICMLAPILWVETIKEFKTKPLQRAVKDLQSHGLQPDILLCRVDRHIPEKILEKVANLTNVPRECVFDAPDVPTVYQVPIELYNRNFDDLIVDLFHMKRKPCRITKYKELVEKCLNPNLPVVNIGIFGKYRNCEEAYTSIKHSLVHAGVFNDVKVEVKWVDAEALEKGTEASLVFVNLHGIIVPGGFDARGVEGKIKAIQYSRENKVPFLGICLGLQCAVIEFARNVCGLNANSIEFDKKTQEPVIHYVEGQEGITKKSGTMRLGAYDCKLEENSVAFSLYGKHLISERHRHRYEVNDKYTELFAEKGFIVSGRNPQSNLVEIMELKDHPYFIGTQAHPEFRSRLISASPLFVGLVAAAKNKLC